MIHVAISPTRLSTEYKCLCERKYGLRTHSVVFLLLLCVNNGFNLRRKNHLPMYCVQFFLIYTTNAKLRRMRDYTETKRA